MSSGGSIRIPLVDLVAQYRSIQSDIDGAIQRVLFRGQFILGPEVEAFEQEMATYCQTASAVSVASGTDALELTLRACGIGPGDEVLTTALSFFATAEAIAAVGARPVFVDVEPVAYALDVAQLAAKVTPRTKAIIPVHLYGHPCALEEIQALATRHNLLVIEDCAQAIGARYRGKPVGSFGVAGCFSFYPSKNLGAYGDAGMVVTRDRQLAERIRLWRAHGAADNRTHRLVAKVSRLDELQAAILRAKLPHLEAWNQARRQHAQRYRQFLSDARVTEVTVPVEKPDCVSVYHVFVIRCRRRDAVLESLLEQGIGAQVHYMMALPFQPALSFLGHRPGEFPVSEQITREIISLPLYPELTDAQARDVVAALQRALLTT